MIVMLVGVFVFEFLLLLCVVLINVFMLLIGMLSDLL